MNLPSSWLRMSFYQRMVYLVNTHQAKSFAEARKLMTQRKALQFSYSQPTIARLPYKED